MQDNRDEMPKDKAGAQSATNLDPTIRGAGPKSDKDVAVASNDAMRELQITSNQLYRAANDLQRTNRFQSMILDSINQGIVVVDEFSQLVAWNDEFLKLYGISKSALHKGMDLQSFSRLFASSKDSPTSAETLSFNHRLGSLTPGDYLDVLADGAAIEIRVGIRGSGGLIATYTDVTSHFATEARLRAQGKQLSEQISQLQTLGESLEEARNQAIRSDQDKSRFLAMISHDIRTPMSAIISSLELLSDDDAQSDQKRLLQVALASGRQMLFLLSDIIEVSRTDGWNFTIKTEDAAVKDLLESVVDGWQSFAQRKSVKLALNIASTVPNSMQTDPMRLRQVFDNLLSNAIKFTDIGSVTVFADIVGATSGSVFRIRVQDTGRGINDDLQHKLFKEFGRVESAGEPKVEGTGLGLSISKRIIESMGGSIGAESTAGSGSVFWIELPFTPGTPAIETVKAAQVAEPEISSEARALRILIADDYELNRIVITALLEKLGCSCAGAVDGQQAFELFEAEDFDAILMDNQMPLANGVEVAKRIRASNTEKKSIPIIGLTAFEGQAEHDEMLEAGMTAVYTKPLREPVLRSILQTYLSKPETKDAPR